MASTRPQVVGEGNKLTVSRGRARAVASYLGLGVAVTLAAGGLFLRDASLRLGAGMELSDVVRLGYVVYLAAGLGYASLRFARKYHSRLDELMLLVFLTCGVNLIVQLTGGARSYWQGLYLVLGGLASVAFSRRLVVVLVVLVLFVETVNGLVAPETSWLDIVRLAILFLSVVVGYNYMERVERVRAERAEDRLLRLSAGLEQLADSTEGEDALSPLSEDGRLAGRAEQMQRLEHHLEPLLALAWKATGARSAVLLQVAEGKESFWVRLSTIAEPSDVESREMSLRGSFLSPVLESRKPVHLSDSNLGYRLAWRPPDDRSRSLFAIPIQVWDEPPWILLLEHGSPDFFDVSRREMASAVAEQMSEAQALFRRQAKQLVDELELKGLLGASEKLSGTSRLADLLRHVVDYAHTVLRFDTCAICLTDEGRAHFTVVVAEGYPGHMLGATYPLESATWAGWVLRAREEPLAIRMERRSGMPILDAKERPTTGTSFLAVPLRAQSRVLGALLLTRDGGAFTARELRLLRIYCNQAAVAIENAIVYERVESLAATDALTGLYNRRYLEQALSQEVSRADRSSSGLALLLLDIDHFKSFNDTYGHAMGDLVLKDVAATLQGGLRKADVLARYGGEEFVVLLPQVTPEGALESAERIRESVARSRIHPGGPGKRVTVSVGLAMIPYDVDSGTKLVEAADRALYLAKERGRNRVCRFADLESEYGDGA